MCDLWNKRREKLEQAVKDAAMELFGHTSSAAFRLDLGSGLYVEAGPEGAHLTRPAQAVDEGAVRAVAAEASVLAAWETVQLSSAQLQAWSDKLTAALPNANGKEWS